MDGPLWRFQQGPKIRIRDHLPIISEKIRYKNTMDLEDRSQKQSKTNKSTKCRQEKTKKIDEKKTKLENRVISDLQDTGKKHKKQKKLKDVTLETMNNECSKDDSKKKKSKKVKQVLENRTEDESLTTGKKSSESSKDHKKHRQIRKKKHFNKDAIEKMKARQHAKKEKFLKQTPPPPKPEPKKRRRPKLPIRLESVELRFEEDDTMTEFEGAWVPKEETGRLTAAREDLERRGLAPEKVQRRMKQLVRREHRKLKLRMIGALAKSERAAREREQFLAAQSARGTPRPRRRLPGKPCGLALREGTQLAKFDGFWVSAEAVPRLEALRQSLTEEGKSEAEVRRLLRKARRTEERKVKSTGRLSCTRCGGRGHLGSECSAPEPAAGGTACFRCGEPGHRLSDCPRKDEIAGLPFATCYLCQQRGHMSRDCPQRQEEQETMPAKRQRTETGEGDLSWRGLAYDEGEEGKMAAQAQKVVKARPGKVAAPRVKRAPPVKGNVKHKQHVRFD